MVKAGTKGEKTVQINIRVSKNTHRKILRAMRKLRMTKADLMCRAVDHFVPRYTKALENL